jgi:hypothetical protein
MLRPRRAHEPEELLQGCASNYGWIDGAATLHLGYCSSRHVEIAIEIGLERAVKMLIADVSDVVRVLLKCGIVDQDVELAERLDSLGDRFLADLAV